MATPFRKVGLEAGIGVATGAGAGAGAGAGVGDATGTVPLDPLVAAATIVGVDADVVTVGLEVEAATVGFEVGVVTAGVDVAAAVLITAGAAGDFVFVPVREAPDAAPPPPPLLPPEAEAPRMELEAGADTTGTIADVPALAETAGTIDAPVEESLLLLSPNTPWTRVILII